MEHPTEPCPVDVAPVGRVLGTEDSTPLEFWVAVAPEQFLQLDDVVATQRRLPGSDTPVAIYGVVSQVRARHEGARFDSDVFLIEDGSLPANVVEAALVQATRFEPEVFVPPTPGQEVRRAAADERDRALFFDGMTQRLPAGLSRNGEPMALNVEFIDGSRGAHVNISGISGVATKTSYATFLLYGLFHSGVLGADAANSRALIFNVKGEDLLFLDQVNARLDDAERARYQALGLPAGPFASVAVLAPPRRGDANATPDVSSRSGGVTSFLWTLEEFCRLELLPFLFVDAEDDRQQYTLIVHHLARRLASDAVAAGSGAVKLGDQKSGEKVARTFGQFVDIVCDLVDNDDAGYWTGRSIATGSINAFVRRLMSSRRHLEHLIRGDIANPERHAIRLDGAQVTVVDLHNLHDRAKRFVTGVVLRRAFEDKERSASPRPLLFVVLDELNKYAPREGSSPIKEILLDIAERGRSLGIILIGAQQTASEVERRIVANSAIRVVGRLDPAESMRQEYGFLGDTCRKRATILKPGSMFVTQPELPIPLLVNFPFPAWATRPSEVVAGTRFDQEAPEDPFAGLPGAR